MNDSEERLRAQLVSQGELVGSLTHDLKGLLTGLEGGLYMVDSGRNKGKKERIDQGFEMLRRNLSRMKRTVSSVLYYVKDRELDCLPIDLRSLTESVTNALSVKAKDLGSRLTVESEDGTFEGDEFAVLSLLVNLAEYLLDSCSLAKLKPSPSVTLSAVLKEEYVFFDLVAEGFLIEEEVKEEALGEHYSPRAGDRTHILPYIAHKLIESHCGNLDICSLPDEEATRFLVKLPAHRTKNEEQTR